MFELLRHPDQFRMLAERPVADDAAVEEMLRWVSPIKNMARTATRDVELHGETLEKGQKLLLLYPSANRDERVFDHPERFDITRTPNDHVAFGFGAHFCLGNRLARLELAAMFDRLLDRLPDLPWPKRSSRPGGPANFVSGYETMPVTFTPIGDRSGDRAPRRPGSRTGGTLGHARPGHPRGRAARASTPATPRTGTCSAGAWSRRCDCPGFPAALAFVDEVGALAEAADHHPDIDIRYNRVTLSLVTHDSDGITRRDLDLAGAHRRGDHRPGLTGRATSPAGPVRLRARPPS